jgi:hypothetical protein
MIAPPQRPSPTFKEAAQDQVSVPAVSPLTIRAFIEAEFSEQPQGAFESHGYVFWCVMVIHSSSRTRRIVLVSMLVTTFEMNTQSQNSFCFYLLAFRRQQVD